VCRGIFRKSETKTGYENGVVSGIREGSLSTGKERWGGGPNNQVAFARSVATPMAFPALLPSAYRVVRHGRQ
jgi:hypothetical protein